MSPLETAVMTVLATSPTPQTTEAILASVNHLLNEHRVRDPDSVHAALTRCGRHEWVDFINRPPAHWTITQAGRDALANTLERLHRKIDETI